MAKKNQQPVAAPAISTIPLADQESPLVIDLPDGQKLVVGNIAHGTVIEVATWRGTGRPDSRTSRLMLGVSSSATGAGEAPSSNAASEQAATPGSVKRNPIREFFDSLVTRSPRQKRARAVKEIDEILKDEVVDSSQSTLREPRQVSKALDDDGDIQSWLDELMSGAQSELASPSSEAKIKRISSPGAKPGTKKKSKRKPRSRRSATSGKRKSAKTRSRAYKKR
jgi:hypothetical protein